MDFKISRNDQEYGPYTLQELHQYVKEGSILPNDYAYNGMEWIPVSQLLQDPHRGLATASSVSSSVHAVSSIGDKTSQTNNPRSKSVLNRKAHHGCFPIILLLVGIFVIIKSNINGNLRMEGLGVVFIFFGVVMFYFLFLRGSGGSGGSGGYFGCSSCSGGSSCSSCGGGCGGCGGGD